MPNPALIEPLNPHPRYLQWCEPLSRFVPIVRGGDGPNDSESDDSTEGDDSTESESGDDTGTENDKTEQPDIDAIVQKRLGQARKQWDKEQADAAAKAKMTEAEQAKAEKAEAEKAADEKSSAADARVIRAEAKVAAVAAGVKPDRAAAFLRILELDGVELDDDGEPDAKAIAAAIKSTLADFPEFKGVAGKGGPSGGEHGDSPKAKPKSLAEAVAGHYST